MPGRQLLPALWTASYRHDLRRDHQSVLRGRPGSLRRSQRADVSRQPAYHALSEGASECAEVLLTRPQKRIASAIILNALPLATNANGAILLTWLLEASELPGRYRLLAPRLAPHLNHLCTHKLASSTLIRVVNQSTDPAAVRADASWRALTITGSADPGRPVRERADARGHPERLGACTDPIDLSSRPRTTAWAS